MVYCISLWGPHYGKTRKKNCLGAGPITVKPINQDTKHMIVLQKVLTLKCERPVGHISERGSSVWIRLGVVAKPLSCYKALGQA